MTPAAGDDGRTPPAVITLGECLIAFVAGSPGPLAEVASFERHVAGSEANVAVGLARLGHRTAYIGRVGDDGFGTAIVRRLRGEGVDVRWITVDPAAPTGVYVRERRVLGPVDVRYYRSGAAGAAIDADDVGAAAASFAGARWLHLTGITPALSASARSAVDAARRLARRHGLTVSVDVNMRRRLWTEAAARPVLRDLVAGADMVFADLDEAGVVLGSPPTDAGAAAAGLLALGPSTAVIKLGAAGSYVRTGAGDEATHPGFLVPTAVDPIGAGDGFVAACIAARLDGLPWPTALAWGDAAGAAVVGSLGDQTGLPTRPELDAIIAGGRDAVR